MSETDSKPAGHQGDSEGAADKKEHRPKLQHDDIPLPPKDFIPLKASEEERLSYGFPARPNPETHRKQYEIWERTLGVPLKIQPQVNRLRRLGGSSLFLQAQALHSGAPQPASIRAFQVALMLPRLGLYRSFNLQSTQWVAVHGQYPA